MSEKTFMAKEEPPLPVCGVCSGGVCSEWCGYEAGKADGAAQERAKIVKWLTLHGQLSLAKFIERGEAGCESVTIEIDTDADTATVVSKP